MLDFSKAFELINHCLLIEKLQLYDLPEHIIRWMAAFVLDRNQRVNIGKHYSQSGLPQYHKEPYLVQNVSWFT